MNADAVRESLQRQPFQPFVMVLSVGERCEVRHPELVVLARTHLALADPVADRIRFVSLMHINTIDVLQPA